MRDALRMNAPAGPGRASLVYDPGFLRYDFGPSHPLRPERITAGFDLLQADLLWEREGDNLAVMAEPDDILQIVHDRAYVEAVRLAAEGAAAPDTLSSYGLNSADNPAFPDMHNAAALVTGGSVEAIRHIFKGTIDHAFNPAGGLHHAHRDRASGFCIYNDPAVAAAIAVQQYGARVLYVDFDCHHGDGVQWIFYDDPRVLTVSFHESGEYLFPGTGGIDEMGVGKGLGYSVNVPLAPYTDDSSWMEAVNTVLPPLAQRFNPDLIISSHGADTHSWDPLTHLELTTSSFVAQAALVHQLAHACANGRWLAVGSGGYDWCRVVPRAWAIVWCEMSGRVWPETLSPAWRQRWQHFAPNPLPSHYLDDPTLSRTGAVFQRVAETNRATLHEVRRLMEL